MTFLYPTFIYYLLPILIVLFALLMTQKESQAEFFSDEVMDKLRVSANSLTLQARNALFFLVGVLMIFALAQPVIKDGKIEVKAKSTDILIALDISDSMLAQDIYPNRLESAKQKAMTLLDEAKGQRIGIVAFAKNSYLVSPTSFDTGAVSFLLSKLDANSITQKGTDFISMLEVVANTNSKADKKYLLILSDGGDQSDFSEEISLAKEKGIVVFVLGMGTLGGAPIKLPDGSFIKYHDKIIISKLNDAISELAVESGGTYIQSTTSSKDIKAMLQEILNNSQHKELKTQEIQRYIALFYYPVILAMLILLIAFSSIGRGIKNNLPTSVFILFALMFTSESSEAGVFDFMMLDNAKTSYEAQDYNSSAQLYEKYATQTNNGEAYYNAGNAYYKEGKYLEAISAYSNARFDSKALRAKNLSNMANAYVKLGKKETLQRAVEIYKKSLKITKDKETKENLEAVKKALEEEKKKDKKEKSKDDKKDKDKKERSSDEQGEDSDKADDSKKDKSKDKDSKKNKNSKSDKKESSGEQNMEDDAESKKESDNAQSAKNDDDVKKKEQEKAKELKDEKEADGKPNPAKSNAHQMSDKEEKKWLEQLNTQQNTYLYRLNKQTNKKKDEDEKPW